MNYRKFPFVFVVAMLVLLPIKVYAQDGFQRGAGSSANCGDIIESEFTANYEEEVFEIDLKAGDTLDISIVPLGNQLSMAVLITGPTNLGVAANNGNAQSVSVNIKIEPQPKAATGVLSRNGKYKIRIINFSTSLYYFDQDQYFGVYDPGGVGVYTLYLGCTLRDGTVINPGDTLPQEQPPEQSPVPTELPTNFVGFPGLAPVDFSSAFRVSINLGVPNEGEIPATGNNVLGFKFSANAGDKMDLSFTRAAGNLNLGLVVLSSTNQVIYMAALVNSEIMTSRFTLPDAGEYTIGVFRLDLLPPPVPENTSFQIQATLNS